MGFICLNYDSSIVDGLNFTVPTSLWNLTEPEWKGKVALPSPITSSPGRGFMLATLDYFDWQNNDEDFSDWRYWFHRQSHLFRVVRKGLFFINN